MNVSFTSALLAILCGIATPAFAAPPGGGWDLNDAKISVSRSKLLTPKEATQPIFRGGWDGNNAKSSAVCGSKLLSPEHK